MKLAYFSPLSPQRSGIADYSEELLPYLAEGADITLFVDGFHPANREMNSRFEACDYRRRRSALKQLDQFDAIIYHLGNDHRYHAGMLAAFEQHPGVVVFHDFALQDFFLGLSRERHDWRLYLNEVEFCCGKAARDEAAQALDRGATPAIVDRPLEFPLNRRIANSAEAIIAHSEWACAHLAKLAPLVPVRHIAMPVNIPAADRPRTNSPEVQIASFGLVQPGKGIEHALRALAVLKKSHAFRYHLVGEANHFFDVRELIRRYGLEDRVEITGHVTLDEFKRRIDQTDIALNFRERTVGETSASLVRLMSAGVCSIVADAAWYGELPGDSVVKIPLDHDTDALFLAYLKRLIEDEGLRRRLGENARKHALSAHDVKQRAADYLTFLHEVIDNRPRRKFLAEVSHEIESLGIKSSDDQFLSGVAKDLARVLPATTNLAVTEGAHAGISSMNASPNGKRPASGAMAGRLPKVEGVDFKRAALEYPHMLDAERSYYLRTKPFYNLAHKPVKHSGYGMDPETHRHFSDFANMAVALALPAGAKILDVGCGSGWLSEYFARLGYDTTGIDISDDLIRMARERVQSVPYDLDHETSISCRFLTHDIEVEPLPEKYDAVICYDSLHHLVDERAVFRHLAVMLNVGGLLFILEGHKPLAGSATENELRDVMHQYGTLESPFSSDYLSELISANGFVVVGDYVSVNGLFECEMLEGNPGDRVLPLRTLPTDYHYLSCMKVFEGAPATSVTDSRKPGLLRAEFRLRNSPPKQVEAGGKFELSLTVKNAGDTLWLSGQTVRAGVVMPGVRIIDARGQIITELHGHPMLPQAVPPGLTVDFDTQLVAPASPGTYTITIDLVDQHVCWFEERGSQPLVLSFEVKS